MGIWSKEMDEASFSKFQKLLKKLSNFGVFSAIRRPKVGNGFSLLDKNEGQCVVTLGAHFA